ncbi:MAG: hypothetical protein QM535_01640 [Limnohabitans sp.]|nr:hypothetical protein [Limnohabitans sp.]
MSSNVGIPFIKFSAVAFASIALVYGLKYYESKEKINKLNETIVIDKKTYANDLKEIFERYDEQVSKNKYLLKEIDTKVEFNSLLKENFSTKKAPKIIYTKLVSEKSYDSLKRVLHNVETENKELNDQVSSLFEKNKELTRLNSTNEAIASISKNLTAVNVTANGIKIVSNNIIETKKFSSMEQIKVCFTLLENRAAIKGGKDIFIQIVNPNNKVVSKNGETLETQNRLLHYSAKTNVFYDNEEMDVCVFVEPNKEDILKGDYEINIYSGITLIGNTVFSLK